LVCKLPLFDPGPNRAPWLRSQAPTLSPQVELHFPRLSSLSVASLATLRCPWSSVSFFPCFRFTQAVGIRPRPRSARYPCSIQARTAPPGCHARLLQPSKHSLPRLLLNVWLDASFTGFRQLPPRRFHLSGPETILQTLYDTAFFRFAPASSGRVPGMHATPVSYGETEPPGRHPSCARTPLQQLIAELFRLIADDFPRVRFSSPIARLSPRGSQGHAGQVTT